MTRTAWHLRANSLVVLWLLAAAIVALVHRNVPASSWLMVHLLLLGGVTTAILIWSEHFAQTLLRTPNRDGRRGQTVRLAVHTLGAVTVVVGIVAAVWPLTVAGGALVGGNAIAHALALVAKGRRALPARFAHLVRYYIAASLILPLGVTAGVIMARGSWLSAGEHARFYLSHVTLNVLGWVGLTVVGTLVTLWPTVLRTKLDDRAEKAARRTFGLLLAALLVIQIAALLGVIPLVAVGAAIYVAGLVLLIVPAARTAIAKPPTGMAAWTLAAAVAWLIGCVIAFGAFSATSANWVQVGERLGLLTTPIVVGFAAQILIGAMSYLVPVVIGGGPQAVRSATAELDRGAAARVVLTNAGLAICLLPVPSLVRVVTSLFVLGALVSFLPLVVRAVIVANRQRGARREAAGDAPASVTARRGPVGLVTAAAGTLVLAVALGVAADPAAVGLGTPAASSEIMPTGQTTTVQVTAKNMRFYPPVIQVPVGNRLVIEVTNADSGEVHDLVLDTGVATGRLAPGASATIEVPVVGRDIDGWCSVAGHRQMGMVLQIEAIGAQGTGATPGGNTGAQGGSTAEPPHGSHGDTDAPPKIDLLAPPGPNFRPYDATLAPAPEATTHRVTLTVTEYEAEVAPGVRQQLWSFGGSVPGPTLRGKVGDKFEITLVNDGTLGHSIDFHAGMLAPDQPMRTIAPGETLTYTFTAQHSGAWLYHCSTMPMSLHIANGMFGAVIIDPPDLDPVDREYVLVQSELYLGGQGQSGDLAKVQADTPDLFVFNGYGNQYDAAPLRANVGERVRFWVIAAGPNRGTAFHVIGGQFDTVFHEGRYLLRAGETTGASQVMGLAAAQGGFVELTFPEAGNYPFVDHAMVAAEHGAHGIVAVK